MSSWQARLPKWWWWVTAVLFGLSLMLSLTCWLQGDTDWQIIHLSQAAMLLVAGMFWLCWSCPVLDSSELNPRWTCTPRQRLHNLRWIVLTPAFLFLLIGALAMFSEMVNGLMDGYSSDWNQEETIGLIIFVIGLVMVFWSRWLFQQVKRRLQRATLKRRICYECGYDLRGTMDAGRTSCPECGQSIPTFPSPS